MNKREEGEEVTEENHFVSIRPAVLIVYTLGGGTNE